jgi:predicted nucleic acid-binding protein
VNILVDTSVWSLAFRRKPEQLNAAELVCVSELKEIIGEDRARMVGLIRQELLSGIRVPAHFEKLRDVLRSFPDELIQTADHEVAAQASNECRRKGIAVSLVDALLCAIALRREWSIFSLDPDFKAYARILPLRLHAARDTK